MGVESTRGSWSAMVVVDDLRYCSVERVLTVWFRVRGHENDKEYCCVE